MGTNPPPPGKEKSTHVSVKSTVYNDYGMSASELYCSIQLEVSPTFRLLL